MKTSFHDKLAQVGLFLAVLCLLAVAAFHFPGHLSNPQLRAVYDVDLLRLLLLACLCLSFSLGLAALMFSRRKLLAAAVVLVSALATLLGGSTVEVQVPVQQKPFYLSLDLIVLDLLLMSVIFVPLERLFPLRRQRVLREGLSTDLSHYALNHLLMGGLLVLIVWPGNWIQQHLFADRAARLTQQMPLWLQVVGILFVADFAQYWMHRWMHSSGRLWRFHKLHHSTARMDWLASSRLHVGDVVLTRAFSYMPIACLGFSPEAVQIYLPVVALQALLVHSNIRLDLGPLRYVLTTPQVHHWHHSSQEEGLDRNFAVTFSIIDVVFGTFHCPRRWPERYGLHRERISSSFFKQLLYPFLGQLPSAGRR
jgi:sterol desaturase/sphingolipid hydroxylase (fatty acid hydroxylase superfamily)